MRLQSRFAIFALALLPVCGSAQVPHALATWATAQQAPDPRGNQPGLDPAELTDATVREVVHLSAGGPTLRLHMSNVFGTEALRLDSVHIAQPVAAASSAIVPGSDTVVHFNGSESVTIPPGAEYVSDPVTFQAAPTSNLTISFHLPVAPAGQTTHPGAHATSYLLHGLHTADADLPGADKQEHWYQLASVDVLTGGRAQAIVCFGDSITDGHAATENGNDRWPDVLAARVAADPTLAGVSVVNEGIGGNHLLTNGLGENALGRFTRDVLGPDGGAYLVVFEGINDVGMLARGRTATPQEHAELVTHMTAALGQIIDRAHAHGMKVYGATITPFMDSDYYKPTAANEADRMAVNAWIRQPGHFDAVVDFDALVRDPTHPDHLLPAADSGDHLHPGPAGYRILGSAVPLSWFR